MAMKIYTSEEKLAALYTLPRPIQDFARSNTITEIYMGLAKKHKLNWREIGIVSEIANLALMGLEPESSVETNIHLALPEITNAAGRELVADINDRIFKEAKRRLKENIVEADAEWNEKELGAKPKEGEARVAPVSDEELDRLAEEEDKKGGFVPPDDEEELAPPAPTAPGAPPASPAPSRVGVAEGKLTQAVTAKPLGAAVPEKDAPKPATSGAEPEKKELRIDPYREQI